VAHCRAMPEQRPEQRRFVIADIAIIVVGALVLSAELATYGTSVPWLFALACIAAVPGAIALLLMVPRVGSYDEGWRTVFRYLDAFRFSIALGGGLIVRFVLLGEVHSPAREGFYSTPRS
jgi:uncharacterized membrane protein YeaQ/YmgE (transglycosylase-associated protein family)